MINLCKHQKCLVTYKRTAKNAIKGVSSAILSFIVVVRVEMTEYQILVVVSFF